MYDAVRGVWSRVFRRRPRDGADGGRGTQKPTNAYRSDRESSSPRQRWLCLAMGGAVAVVALTLGLRLIFALQPSTPKTPDAETDALSDAFNATDHGVDAGAALPGACGATCGHVLCSNVREPNGVADVLRRYLLDLKYFEACRLPSSASPNTLSARSQRVAFRRSSFAASALAQGWLDDRLRVGDLQLFNCRLRRIHDNAFNSVAFGHTHGLMLEGNELETLGPRAFAGLRSLKVLVITRNSGLKTVSPNVLRPVATSLRILTVQYSLSSPRQLTSFAGGVRLPAVEKASFSHNNLKILEPSAFKGLPFVDSLSLKDSNITSLAPGVFDVPSKSLRELSLEGNQLTAIPKSVLEPIAAAYIELHDNPWNCTCSLAWFAEFVLRRQTPKQSTPQLVCASPTRNRGVPLLDADFCPSFEENSAEVQPLLRFVIQKTNSSARIVRVPYHSDPSSSERKSQNSTSTSAPTLQPTSDSTFPKPSIPSSSPPTSQIPSNATASSSSFTPQSSISGSRSPGEIRIPCGNSNTDSRLVTIRRQGVKTEDNEKAEEVPAIAASFTVSRIEKDAVEVAVRDVRDLVYWYPQDDAESEHLPEEDTGCLLTGPREGALRVGGLRPRRSYVICLANGAEENPPSEAKCVAVQTTEGEDSTTEETEIKAETAADSTKGNYLLAISVLVVLLVGLTFYILYGFLCRARGKDAKPRSSAVSTDRAVQDGREGKKGIFWLSDNGKLCTDVQIL